MPGGSAPRPKTAVGVGRRDAVVWITKMITKRAGQQKREAGSAGMEIYKRWIPSSRERMGRTAAMFCILVQVRRSMGIPKLRAEGGWMQSVCIRDTQGDTKRHRRDMHQRDWSALVLSGWQHASLRAPQGAGLAGRLRGGGEPRRTVLVYVVASMYTHMYMVGAGCPAQDETVPVHGIVSCIRQDNMEGSSRVPREPAC
jgi:hypothetical protein